MLVRNFHALETVNFLHLVDHVLLESAWSENFENIMRRNRPFSELLARVQALIRRDQKNARPTILAIGSLQMDLLKHEVYRDGVRIDLPAKEFGLLEYMMRNPEVVLSKTSILERVYDYAFDPQTNVVDVLVCRLRNKIDKDYEQKMIHTVRGMGYVLRAR